jgi:PilZ domain
MVSTLCEPHEPIVLPVRVFGIDANNRPFYQYATARDLTAQGAVLEGLENPLKTGEVVGVQYKEKKARARVVWTCNLRIETVRVGIQFLDALECPWIETLEKVPCTEARPDQEKRRHVRYRICVGVEIQGTDSNSTIHAQSADLSLGGCYVGTLFPLPIGTGVNLEFWIGPERIAATGSVRTSDPGVGMGIEFTNLSANNNDRLKAFLGSRIPAASQPREIPEVPSTHDDRPIGP